MTAASLGRVVAFIAIVAACGRSPRAATDDHAVDATAPSTPTPTTPTTPASVAQPAPPLPPAAPLPPRIELAEVDRYTFGIAVDDTHVYWVDYDSGSAGGIYRARKDRPGREQLAGSQPFARDIAVDDRFAYVALAGGLGGAIVRVPKAGGALEVFAAAQANPDRVLTHAGRVLWNAMPPGVVRSTPAANGGPNDVVVKGEAFLLTLRGTELFWVDRAGFIHHAPAAGGDVKDIGNVGKVPSDMAVDDRFVYVSDAGTPEMPRSRPCPKNTPCPVATTAPNFHHGEIVRIPIAGGDKKTMVYDLAHVGRIAVDGERVYFSSERGLQSIAKDGSGSLRTHGTERHITSRMVVDGDRLIFEADRHIVSLARLP